jgi:methionyl-tRNA formyltransferase
VKVAVIGCVAFSADALRQVLALSEAEVVGVVTRRRSDFNADFACLADIAEPLAIPIFFAEGRDQEEMAAWLRATGADVIYCFGWSYLLRRPVLTSAPLGVIGFHPAALPANRGRHPLIWALALGLEQTASTFFHMDEGADTGDILSQEPVQILDTDDAASLYAKVSATALAQIAAFTPRLATETVPRRPQPPEAGNVWRKRGRLDGQIDWRMSGRAIRNLVRALTRPYVGAHCIHAGQDVKVWAVSEMEWPQRNIEPGKVLRASDADGLVVKCDDGAVAILKHEFEVLPVKGTYL